MGATELETKRWWKDDPHANSLGFGVVLHKEETGWIVNKVLKGSPAEKAGVKVKDSLNNIAGYSLHESAADLNEALQLLQLSKSPDALTLNVGRADTEAFEIRCVPRLLSEILESDLVAAPEEAITSFCRSCRGCSAVSVGWVNCGPRGCSGECRVG